MSTDVISTTFKQLIADGVLQIGDGHRAKLEELGGDGLIFLRAGNVSDDAISFDDVERFHTSLAQKIAQKVSRPGDTIITTKGNSTGRTSYVTDDMPSFVYSPHLSFWRSKQPNQLHPGFLRYWARGEEFQEQLRGMMGSTDMAPYLSLTDQEMLRITVPAMNQQSAIARILGALDEKIELNRRMNRTLEMLSQKLFKSWFVDFEPVVAKSEGRKPFGLSDELASLFPAAFESSTLGPIPQGWRVEPLSECIEVNPRRVISQAEATYVEMGNLPTFGHVPVSWTTRRVGSGMRFMNGDVLVARITPCLENGKTAYISFLGDSEVAWGSTEYIVLRSKSPMPLYWAYLLARSEDFRAAAIQGMTGSSGRQRVPQEVVANFKVAVADEGILRAFGRTIDPIVERIDVNANQCRSLAGLRDLLLPKLLSGEIRVSEANSAVEAAGQARPHAGSR